MGRALTRATWSRLTPLSVLNVVISLRSKRFCAEDRSFLSEAGQFPFGKPLTGVARPRMFCITAGLVQMDSYIGVARLVLLVTMHLVLCFFPCLQARDARHHSWYGPGDLVCWFLALSLALYSSCCLRPQMPVIMAGMDHRTVWRFTGAVLERGFLHARCCATSVLVQTVL